MRRKSFSVPRSLCAVAVLVAAVVSPTALAQGDQPFGFLTTGPPSNAGSGVVPLVGWALDDDGIEAVDVLVDGVTVGRALYGGDRPDVALAFPGFPNAAKSGVTFHLDTTRLLNGLHVVSGVAVSTAGERSFLGPLTLQVINVAHILQPFGLIDRPLPHVELFGNCSAGLPRRLTVVDGWALDVGVQQGDSGVGYVELLLDGVVLASSARDCVFDPLLGGWSSCYGVRMLGLETLFPQVIDAPHGGFRFVFDVGLLIDELGWTEGLHVLSVRAGDRANQVAVVDTVPILFRCANGAVDDFSIGEIDLPRDGNFLGGVVPITGYAVDLDGVDTVQVFVDGLFQGTATYGIPRPEVAALHPGFPDSATAGWIFHLDTRELSNGPHELQVIVIDDGGRDSLIGERPFLVANGPAGASGGARPKISVIRSGTRGR
jgi:N-acetylmuramoyl-L-alanine amidase